MKKLTPLFAALVAFPLLAFAAPVFADSPGQLGSGPNEYVVKNLTQNGAYGDTASSSVCNDVFEYSLLVHNTEYGELDNIVLTATLPNGSPSTSTVTAVPTTGASTGMTGSVTVTYGSGQNQTLAYVAGSTTLYDGGGNVVKTLPDGITSKSGINIGNLEGSTSEYVNFKAEVSCQSTPTCQSGQTGTYPNCVSPTCPSNETGTYPNCTTTTTTPPVNSLPNTGAGNVIGLGIGAIVFGTIASRLYLGRKLSRSNK